MDYATVLQILDSAVRLMTPLLLACLAGLFSERSGIFDIGLEGKMLIAAFAAGAAGAMTGSVLFFFSLGYGARLLAPVFARPAAWRVLDAAVALVMWAIAATLILGG